MRNVSDESVDNLWKLPQTVEISESNTQVEFLYLYSGERIKGACGFKHVRFWAKGRIEENRNSRRWGGYTIMLM